MSDQTPQNPELLVLRRTPIADSVQRAIARELEQVPDNALEVEVVRDSDETRLTGALRIDRNRWALGVGGWLEARDGEPDDYGLFGSIKIKL